MLSICIPIYNFDVTRLVTALAKQIEICSLPAELVLIDDCSSIGYKTLNKDVCTAHKYLELKKNIGRSKIRNLFLEYTSYDYLLFLDCDSLIISDQFIQHYLKMISPKAVEVICGGRIYNKLAPSKNQKLSWSYGLNIESKSLEERLNNPYGSFMTNNFLVSRKTLVKIPFDERLSEYGHEDTLFGYYLKKNNIAIEHINNPVLNGDIENNATYIKKTELAIQNLSSILKTIDDEKSFIQEVNLLAFYKKINSRKLLGLTLFLAPIINTIFLMFLKFGWVSLILFNYYKLSYLAKVLDKKKS